ncbi:MAG: hypothetical protein KF782_12870 [Labilithrix sp.]|nr:hypothetical protein [Labilithrix sp.]
MRATASFLARNLPRRPPRGRGRAPRRGRGGDQKKDPLDFALWKAAGPDGFGFHRQPVGQKGRPGWRIRCSAMAFKELGEHITTSTAAGWFSSSLTTKTRSRKERGLQRPGALALLAARRLEIDGEKMAKSLGNFVTIRTSSGRTIPRATATSSSARTTAGRSRSTSRSRRTGASPSRPRRAGRTSTRRATSHANLAGDSEPGESQTSSRAKPGIVAGARTRCSGARSRSQHARRARLRARRARQTGNGDRDASAEAEEGPGRTRPSGSSPPAIPRARRRLRAARLMQADSDTY